MNPSISTTSTPSFRVTSLAQADAILQHIRTQEVYAEPRDLRLLPSGCLEVNGHRWPLSDIGFASLCRYLHIPLQYSCNIPLDLLATSVNRLMSEKQENRKRNYIT